jgi:hypothetical protein
MSDGRQLPRRFSGCRAFGCLPGLTGRSVKNKQQRYAYKKSFPHAILKTFADDLKLLPIGPRTEQSYHACVRQLSEHYDRSPELLSFEEVRQYCIHLKTVKKVARHLSAAEVRKILAKVEGFDHRICLATIYCALASAHPGTAPPAAR